jgi:hypothetical protein
MSASAKTIAAPSPARLYCTLVGGAVAIAGVIGFFYSAGFETGINAVRGESEEALGFLAVNGWHNLLHLVLGVVGLAAATSSYAARTYALAVGLVYVLLAIWGLGFDDDGVILGLLPLNDGANVLHLVLGLTGLGAGAATPAVTGRPRPKRERPKREPRARETASDPKPKAASESKDAGGSEGRGGTRRPRRAARPAED